MPAIPVVGNVTNSYSQNCAARIKEMCVAHWHQTWLQSQQLESRHPAKYFTYVVLYGVLLLYVKYYSTIVEVPWTES